MRGLWLLLVLVAAAKAEKVFIGDQVIRVNAESEEHIQLLQALETQEEWEVDFWLDPVSTELPVDIRVPRSSLSAVTEYLSSYNIPYSVIINNLQDLLDEEKAEMQMSQMKERSTRSFNFGAYHRLETIYSWMDTLVAQHPNLVTKQEIGRSYENRPMYVLKFSTGGYKRPAIWIDTGIHSREWVSQATGVWTANKIATDFGTDASLTSLLNTMDIYMLLLANPDGYAYTHSNNRMWRKTRSKNSGSSCRGVDPNRNWDAGFGDLQARLSSTESELLIIKSRIDELERETTGFFTAPVKGVYYFQFTVFGSLNYNVGVYVYKNNQNIMFNVEWQHDSGVEYFTNSVILELIAGDELRLILPGGTAVFDSEHNHCTFSGALLFPL